MIWSLETDDFRGKCHGERFPLIKTIYRTVIGAYPEYKWEPKEPRATSKEACDAYESQTTVDPSTTDPIGIEAVDSTTPIPTPASTPIDPSNVCKYAGLNADPEDCLQFYNCVESSGTFLAHPLRCGAGTVFSPTAKTCTHPAEVPQCNVLPISFNRQNGLF
jgi:chitinase